MSNAKRRHYRVARREVAKEKENENAVIIPKKHKACIMAGIIAVIILVFVKGIILGYNLGDNSDC